MYSPTVEKLIKIFAKFPTIGPKTAARFVFYLIKTPKAEIVQLVETIATLKNKTKTCSACQRAFEPEIDTEKKCSICSSIKRQNGQICLVEKEVDLEALEKTKSYLGTYFVLGENASPLKEDEGVLESKTQILLQRIKDENIKEIILALNQTIEGQHTSLWLKRKLEATKIQVTQLG
ncbi:MAG: toprim domain-containing protein, partial [Candidatus Gribaldobacteria bacterium]|nr:toprim domain-containing protein [Candidatus Gribaldobacteria bacterium]